MIKLTLPLGAIIVVICVLPIPNAPAHFAKAGNCTSSAFSQLSNIGTGTGTKSGSCATSAGVPTSFLPHPFSSADTPHIIGNASNITAGGLSANSVMNAKANVIPHIIGNASNITAGG
jgi:hypothetical protein